MQGGTLSVALALCRSAQNRLRCILFLALCRHPENRLRCFLSLSLWRHLLNRLMYTQGCNSVPVETCTNRLTRRAVALFLWRHVHNRLTRRRAVALFLWRHVHNRLTGRAVALTLWRHVHNRLTYRQGCRSVPAETCTQQTDLQAGRHAVALVQYLAGHALPPDAGALLRQ